MKTYRMYVEGKDACALFAEDKFGTWVNTEELSDKDVSEMHPRCDTCAHCTDEVLENEFEDTTITLYLCMIHPDEPKMISKWDHYCALHTELV